MKLNPQATRFIRVHGVVYTLVLKTLRNRDQGVRVFALGLDLGFITTAALDTNRDTVLQQMLKEALQ